MPPTRTSKADAELLNCLADPTRRAILERLRKAPASVGEIAEKLPVSRPAVSQHLRVLESTGLVSVQPRGTQRVYRVEIEGLARLRRYLDAMWDDALRAFERDAARDAGDKAR